MNAYIEIAGGYKYACLRVGTSIMNPQGKEVYFQPGEQESAIRGTIDALEEVNEERRAIIADFALADYFL